MSDIFSEFSSFSVKEHGVRVPEYNLTEQLRKQYGSEAKTNDEFLLDLCRAGYKKLGIKQIDKNGEYTKRLKYEFEIVKELSFVDYFLLVWDVVDFCEKNKIPVGPGRGSGAGSLILFLLGITKIDPIKNGLFFERFISKVRAKKNVVDGVIYLDGSLMCDVDLDICYYRRHELISYLEKKFNGYIAKILTYSTLTGKLLIKEVGKTLAEKSEDEMNIISDTIEREHGHVQDLEIVRYGEKNDKGEFIKNPNEKFADWCSKNEESYKIALKLRGLIKNEGVHASALALSFDPINQVCPTKLTKDGDIVTAYDMSVVLMFMVKLDLLGLKSISVIDNICNNIGIKYGDIDPTDPFIYSNLQDIKCKYGLFQIEAPTGYRVCKKVKPKKLDDLSAILAIARPGALQFDQIYADFVKDGYVTPANTGSKKLDEIMAETGNTILYQETLMRIAHEVFGLSLDEAEVIRKCVGKKLKDKMKEWKDVILKIGVEKKIEKAAEFYWDLLLKSADYSFNRSHSFAYATISAITTYLKFKYPLDFFLEVLRMSRHEPKPIETISLIKKEMDIFGIKLLPPHLLKSEMDFKKEDGNIRFGLSSIKKISDKSIEKINEFKKLYSNKFEIFRGANDSGIPTHVLIALIQSGALEDQHPSNEKRAKIVLEAQLWNVLTDKEKNYCMKFGEKFNYDLRETVKYLKTFKDEKGKVIIESPPEDEKDRKKKKYRFETIKDKYGPFYEIFKQNSSNSDLADWYYENTLIGYSINKTLNQIFRCEDPLLLMSNDLDKLEKGAKLKMVGVVSFVKASTSKKNGSKYYKYVISDESGDVDCLVFSNSSYGGLSAIEKTMSINDGVMPREGKIVIVEGKYSGDGSIFADKITEQNAKIYTRFVDLIKDEQENQKNKE